MLMFTNGVYTDDYFLEDDEEKNNQDFCKKLLFYAGILPDRPSV